MKKILALVLAVSIILTLAPIVIYADEPTFEEGTLIGEYVFNEEFANTEIGKLMLKDYTSENDTFAVSFPEDGGFRITRTAKESSSKTDIARAGINFIKVLDAEKGIYQEGLEGIYAIDITYRGDLTLAPGTSGRTDLYISDVPSSTTKTDHNVRVSPGFKVVKVNGSTEKIRWASSMTATEKTYRWVVDTVNNKFYGYDVENGEYVYRGEDEYDLDKIATLMYSPRDSYITEGSYIEFESVKIYEILDATPEPEIPQPDEPEVPTEPSVPEYPAPEGGILLDDYTFGEEFSKTDIGKMVLEDFTVSGDAYTVSYPAEGGLRLECTADKSPVISPKTRLAINFIKHDDESGITQQGLSGVYAVDIKVKANLTAANGKSGRTDMYFSDVLNNDVATVNELRLVPNGTLYVYDATSNYILSNKIGAESNIYRFVFDTVNHKMYGYDYKNGEFVYKSESVYSPDCIKSFSIAARDGFLTVGSYLDIENIKVYEVENSVTESFPDTFKSNMPESFNYVSGGNVDASEVTESIALPSSWADYTVVSSNPSVIKADGTVVRPSVDKEVMLSVQGVCSGVTFEKVYTFVVKAGEGGTTEPEQPPVEPDVPTDPLLGGKLLFNYDLNKEFAESEIGKKVIVDKFDNISYDYDVTYGDDGIKVEYKGEPVFTNEGMTSGASVNAFGLNLTALMEDDVENGTKLYKTGFSGTYAVEFTVKIDQGAGWTAGTNKSSGRADLYIGDKVETFTETNFINLRYSYKSPSLVSHIASTKDFALTTFKFGNEFTTRIVLDSKNGKYYGYSKNADGTYKFNGEGICNLSALSYFWYGTRTFNENGDAITFKNIKVYEIESYPEAQGETYYEYLKSTLPDNFNTVSGSVADFKSLSENIVISEDIARRYTWTSSNNNILGTDGTINTSLYENTPVTLTATGNYAGVYFAKDYAFTVKERADIQRADIAKYNYANDDAELIYSGDNQVTEDGFEVVNKEYADGTTVGLLKSKKYSDNKSSTYMYDYMGSYDFDIKVAPKLTSGSAYVEIGNYNVDTGVFESYGKAKLSKTGAYYCDEYDDIRVSEIADDYTLKFRINTDEKTIWLWINSDVAYYEGYEYEGDKPVNAYRISFEEAGENDSVVLKNAEFKQLVVGDSSFVSNVLDVANSINANSIVNNPDDAYGTINLPTFKGYNIVWSTDNALADLENKKIYRSVADENITISAIISSTQNSEVKVRKDFYLKVKAASVETDVLDGALAKITADSVTNQKELVADLKLPKVTEEGYTVTWESLSKGYISDEGVINKSINIANKTNVTFKVTVSSNSSSVSKNITFTVAKRGADVAVAPSDITVPVEGVVTYKATVTGNTSGAVKDANNVTLVAFDVENGKASFDYKNSDFARYDVNNTFEIAFVMNFNDRCVTILADGKVLVEYVPMLAIGNGFNKVEATANLSNEKVVLDEYSLFDYNRKVFDYIGTFGNVFVAENRVMNTASVGRVEVVWKSSDNSVVTNAGVYAAPLNITFFDVTLELSTNSGSGAKYIETVNCVAVPDEVSNAASKASVVSTIKDDVVNNKTKLTDNDFTTYLEANDVKAKYYILLELKEIKEINRVFLFQGDDGIKSCDIYLSKDGNNWGEPVVSAVINDITDNYITFDYQDAKFIKIANITCDNNYFKLYEIKAYLGYTADNKAQFDIAALTLPTDYNLKASSIELPAVGSVYGSKLTWTSSKPDVISTTGKITKPSVATEVVLTVKAEFDGTTATKKFTYLVPADKSESTGGSGGGGGGGAAGSISGVNAGGTSISATPTTPEVELEKVEVPKVEKGMFTDTPKDAWYYTYLTDLVEKGVVNGYADGSFGPNNKVTREEFLKMLVSAIGAELTYEAIEYADVQEDDWFAPYVYTAKKLGIAQGVDITAFGVGMPISRQDMCVMIYNTTDKNAEIDDERFTDHISISNYASNAVYAMKTMGVINGYENGEFIPTGNLTRAEAVKVISLVIKMK